MNTNSRLAWNIICVSLGCFLLVTSSSHGMFEEGFDPKKAEEAARQRAEEQQRERDFAAPENQGNGSGASVRGSLSPGKGPSEGIIPQEFDQDKAIRIVIGSYFPSRSQEEEDSLANTVSSEIRAYISLLKRRNRFLTDEDKIVAITANVAKKAGVPLPATVAEAVAIYNQAVDEMETKLDLEGRPAEEVAEIIGRLREYETSVVRDGSLAPTAEEKAVVVSQIAAEIDARKTEQPVLQATAARLGSSAVATTGAVVKKPAAYTLPPPPPQESAFDKQKKLTLANIQQQIAAAREELAKHQTTRDDLQRQFDEHTQNVARLQKKVDDFKIGKLFYNLSSELRDLRAERDAAVANKTRFANSTSGSFTAAKNSITTLSSLISELEKEQARVAQSIDPIFLEQRRKEAAALVEQQREEAASAIEKLQPSLEQKLTSLEIEVKGVLDYIKDAEKAYISECHHYRRSLCSVLTEKELPNLWKLYHLLIQQRYQIRQSLDLLTPYVSSEEEKRQLQLLKEQKATVENHILSQQAIIAKLLEQFPDEPVAQAKLDEEAIQKAKTDLLKFDSSNPFIELGLMSPSQKLKKGILESNLKVAISDGNYSKEYSCNYVTRAHPQVEAARRTLASLQTHAQNLIEQISEYSKEIALHPQHRLTQFEREYLNSEKFNLLLDEYVKVRNKIANCAVKEAETHFSLVRFDFDSFAALLGGEKADLKKLDAYVKLSIRSAQELIKIRLTLFAPQEQQAEQQRLAFMSRAEYDKEVLELLGHGASYRPEIPLEQFGWIQLYPMIKRERSKYQDEQASFAHYTSEFDRREQISRQIWNTGQMIQANNAAIWNTGQMIQANNAAAAGTMYLPCYRF